jgi:hypothetical protein
LSEFEQELYRYEYLVKANPEADGSNYDSAVHTEFLMAESELDALIQAQEFDGNGVYGVRKATQVELIAYDAGFNNGMMLATARDRMENYNGVTYSMDSSLDDIVNGAPLATIKHFRCGGCSTQYDFEDAVMVGRNYLMRLNGPHETQWFVCVKCV